MFVPSLINKRTTPAVVVPVATIEISSTRVPLDAPEMTLTIVPVPLRLVFAVVTCADAPLTVDAYWAEVDMGVYLKQFRKIEQ
jgi:hypothetical protein